MRLYTVTLLLCCGPWSPAAAQWHIGLELANAWYHGTARDTSGNPHARPGNGTTIGVRVDRAFGSWRGALRISYGKPGFVITGEGLTIRDNTFGELIETASLVSFRVGGVGPSGAVRAELGPALHLWKFGDELRTRVSALAAAAYEWPVSARFAGALRLEGMLSKSWFDAADLPPEFERRLTWRHGVTLGLRYRL